MIMPTISHLIWLDWNPCNCYLTYLCIWKNVESVCPRVFVCLSGIISPSGTMVVLSVTEWNSRGRLVWGAGLRLHLVLLSSLEKLALHV